jgi:hypothetical protein
MDIVTRDTDRFIGNLLMSGLLACWTDLALAWANPRLPGVRAGTPLIHIGLAALIATLLAMLLPRIWRHVYPTDRLIFSDPVNTRSARQGRAMGVLFGLLAGVLIEMTE